jgi:hypothetical protein
MKVKQGDLAIVIRSCNPMGQELIGRLLRVVKPSPLFNGAWLCEPQIIVRGRVFAHWSGSSLMPIRDNPGEDEIITIVRNKEKISA